MILPFDDTALDLIAEQLDLERVIVLPTDTLYGLSCTVKSESACSRIRNLKGKRDEKLIVLVGNFEQARELVALNPETEKILRAHWPGPFSFILPKIGGDTLALRMPDFPLLRRLLEKAGPITSTSCNPTGQSPAQTIAQCEAYFGDQIPLYLDQGPCRSTAASTLVDLTTLPGKVLRQGSAHYKAPS